MPGGLYISMAFLLYLNSICKGRAEGETLGGFIDPK